MHCCNMQGSWRNLHAHYCLASHISSHNLRRHSACSSIVVPVVLGASVLLVHAAWYKLRHLKAWHAKSVLWCCLTRECRCNTAGRVAGAPDGGLSFWPYLTQRLLVTLLVLFFDNYDNLAQIGWGMLMCIDVPGNPAATRWVADVRLPCPWWPVSSLSKGWAAGAFVLGLVLLSACVLAPISLAAVLVKHAWRGDLLSALDAGHRVLDFRFKDYNVQYTMLQHEHAHDVTAAVTQSWWQQVTTLITKRGRSGVLHQLKLSRLQLWAVLAWDSILDLVRMLLAVVTIAVMLREQLQLLLVMVVLGIYLALILAIQPWKAPSIWRLQVLALTVLLVSCCCAMAASINDTVGSQGSGHINPDALRYPVLVFNAVYMLVALVVLGSSWFHTMNWSFAGMLAASKAQLPCCGPQRTSPC